MLKTQGCVFLLQDAIKVHDWILCNVYNLLFSNNNKQQKYY